MKKVNRNKIEILAPAGSYDSFHGAIAAGADAVYAGGPRFGARAYAENFTEELLLQAIDYAHFHGRKFYLTVNTLLKESEMRQLESYLEPLYRRGLDAVIVQDLGVMDCVRSRFPEMEIHASTQMTITSPEGASFLKEQGVARVVPARELSLEEIRKMKKLTGMEIECFVHGALCYCYSGQCLLSSLIGGRSGNRGQCAQPCRLPYTVGQENAYWLSPKDICTLDLIPDLVEAGIDSFKIEGRMKRPEYVAGVTALYRKYLDRYLQTGRNGFAVSEEDKETLMDLYNRGGFSNGYYKKHNGAAMISTHRPNHAGVRAVRVTAQKGREVCGTALTDIHKGDVLECGGKEETYTFGTDYQKGDTLQILVSKGKRFAPGEILCRTKNDALLRKLSEDFVFGKIKEKIYGFLTLSVGEPARLILCMNDATVEVYSDTPVMKAEKTPMDEARIRKQMLKTGDTEYIFDSLEIVLTGDVFLPVQQINTLRRRGLDTLKEAVIQKHHRMETICPETRAEERTPEKKQQNPMLLHVLTETSAQFRAAVSSDGVARIYLDSAMEGELLEQAEIFELSERARAGGIEVYLAMPHIFRMKTEELFQKRYRQILNTAFDGVLVRNLESLRFLRKCGFDRNIILDHNLYVWNRQAKAFWKRYGIKEYTLPLELNQRELTEISDEDGELIIYGYLPVMISAQCVTNTVSGCEKKEGIVHMRDRVGNRLTVRRHCRACYNVIYNTAPLYLADLTEEIRSLGCGAVRLQFTVEDEKDTGDVLRDCFRLLQGDIPETTPENYTRGHFRRGVR